MPADAAVVESYRRLADVFHEVLAEQSLDALLVRIADTLAELIPHDTLTIYEADEAQGLLVPMIVRDEYADEIMRTRISFGEGVTGWAASAARPFSSTRRTSIRASAWCPGRRSIPRRSSRSRSIARAHDQGRAQHLPGRRGRLIQRGGVRAREALRATPRRSRSTTPQIRARLEHQAQTDSLTGLFNHRVFHEQLLHALQEASRTHRPVAVLMLDIDNFKRVNDVHGHGVGDELLRLLAETLRACVRPQDIVCRLGGEEFGVIMSVVRRPTTRSASRSASSSGSRESSSRGSARRRLGRSRARPRARDEPARARRVRRGGDDDREGAGQEPHRPLLRRRDGAPRRADEATRDVRSIAHLKMLQSLSGKLNRLNDVRADRRGDRRRAPVAHRLPQLPRLRRRRRRARPVAFRGEFVAETVSLPLELLRIEGRQRHHGPLRRARRVARWSATLRTASSARRIPARRRSRSRCSRCRSGTARASSA